MPSASTPLEGKGDREPELPGIHTTIPPSAQQLSESGSTTARPPHDLQSVRPHESEQETSQPYSPSVFTTITTTNQKPLSPSTDRHHTSSKSTRIAPTGTSQPASYAQVTRSSEDPQDFPPGVAKDIPSSASVASHPSSGRPQNAQVVRSHFPSDEQQGTSEIRQKGFNYGQGIMETIMSFIPSAGPPPKDENQLMRDELDYYKRQLRRTREEMRKANHHINELHSEKEQWKDQWDDLQNGLKNIHQRLKDVTTLVEVRRKEFLNCQISLIEAKTDGLQNESKNALRQLEDIKTLAEVRRELFDCQVFTQVDTLSISEVGEKVTALNEQIFQAATTFGEALIHQRYGSQEELDAAAAESKEMVGEKITSLLISQAQRLEPEVNPLLVQVVLQILMVKFCVSKIQSWYPSDAAIATGSLDAICSEVHSSEGQPVPGRWRTLTRAHARPTTESWTKELCQKIISVLKIAAWIPDSPGNQVESFKQRFPPIFKAVSEIRNAIRDKFASADLDISIFDCDSIYDPSFMEDTYGDSRQPIGNRVPEVVGTTGVGLKKLMVERGANGDLQFQNVISAKIVRESTVENTDGADQDGHVDCQDGRD